MFRSLFHDHLQGSSFVLSVFTTFQLPASSFVFFGFVAICPLFVCVSGIEDKKLNVSVNLEVVSDSRVAGRHCLLSPDSSLLWICLFVCHTSQLIA
jgi:hypothetical protein